MRRAFESLYRHAGAQRLPTNISFAAGDDDGSEEARTDDATVTTENAGGCVVVEDLGCFNQQVGHDASCFNVSDQSALGYGGASLESCLDYCWRWRAADDNGARPVSYIGMESGYQCWCSSQPPGHVNTTACPSTPIEECDAACGVPPPPTPPNPPLPSNETCGGGWRLRAYRVDCSGDSPPRRRHGDTVAAFATTNMAARNNVSVFLSSWDASLPPQGSPSAATFSAPPPVTVRVVLAEVAGGGGGGGRRITKASVVRIDEAHGNPRTEYLKMNTTWPSASQLAELKRASVVTAEALTVGDGKSVELMMPANAAYTVLLELA
eukprot:COSAG06_NODE_7329_length_2544_cov_8.932106_3_plen_323_part_00